MDKELKQIEIEGTNIILLSYSPEKYGIKEVLASVEGLQNRVTKHWKEVANKDYRSPSKRKFDEELAEYLTLYFEGVRVGINHFGTNEDYVQFNWR